MKKNLIRILSVLFAAIMILTLCVGCANNGNSDDSQDQTTAGAEVSGEETADPNCDANGFLKDQLPDNLNYGKTINLLVWDDVEHEEFEAEQNGDTVDSSIFTRNAHVEKRLGVTLNFIRINGNSGSRSQWNTYVGNSVKLNSREFDIIGGYSLSVALNASSGYLYDMLDPECEYLNFDNPWWSQLLVDQATVKNKLYFASGDISRNCLEMMYVCFANTKIIGDHKLTNPQDYVESGDWTYEQFIKMCEGIYADDGDGVKNSSDVFGYMSSGIHVDAWFYGTGATICEKDADGNIIPSPTFTGEKIVNTISMLEMLFYNSNDGIYTASLEHQDAFGDGRILFIIDRARVSHKVLANKWQFTDFIILPCPKYDKDQQDYYTMLGNPFTLYAISYDVADPKMASAVIECFASEGYRNVTPAVFEFSLKSRYSFDSTSARMYDLIRKNITYDLGRIFSDDLIGQGNFKSTISANSVWNPSGVIKILQTKCVTLTNALAGD